MSANDTIVVRITLIYGVTSWCILKKFRNYKNFVLLNAIFVSILYFVMVLIVKFVEFEENFVTFVVLLFLPLYLKSVLVHRFKVKWLLVLCHIFYVDIVKVFNGHIRRKYLKSNLFAWGVALISTLILLFIYYACLYNTCFLYYYYQEVGIMDILFKKGSFILPLIINSCFYIIVLYSLCRSFNTSAHTAINIWRRLHIATLMFILSDVIMLSDYLINITPLLNVAISEKCKYDECEREGQMTCGLNEKARKYIMFASECTFKAYSICHSVELKKTPLKFCMKEYKTNLRRMYGESCPLFCPSHYRPVCGMSKMRAYVYKTFNNGCYLDMLTCRGDEFNDYIEVPLSHCQGHLMKNIFKEKIVLSGLHDYRDYYEY